MVLANTTYLIGCCDLMPKEGVKEGREERRKEGKKTGRKEVWKESLSK